MLSWAWVGPSDAGDVPACAGGDRMHMGATPMHHSDSHGSVIRQRVRFRRRLVHAPCATSQKCTPTHLPPPPGSRTEDAKTRRLNQTGPPAAPQGRIRIPCRAEGAVVAPPAFVSGVSARNPAIASASAQDPSNPHSPVPLPYPDLPYRLPPLPASPRAPSCGTLPQHDGASPRSSA